MHRGKSLIHLKCLAWRLFIPLVLGFRLAFATDTFSGYSQPFVYTEPAVRAPSVPFMDAAGNLQHIADFPGEVLLVNLWATWCAACLYEMPELQALQQAMAGRGLRVLTLNQDLADGTAVRRFLDARGLHRLTAHRDANQVFGRAVNQQFLPMTLLFDARGRQIGYLVGQADWNSAAARDLLQTYLPELNAAQPRLQKP